eukprot:PhM_4_TR9095/c0_g1_i1/m.36799/K00852/rbsK, RBKS; ribokinase
MADRVRVLSSHLNNNGGAAAPSDAAKKNAVITVLGSCFMDYVAYCDRMPKIGETLHSHTFDKGFGGKGANQAVMAGKLGGKVRMVGLVGQDGDGADYIQNFKNHGVDARHVHRVPGQATGLAMIMVDKTSHNSIMICPNATNKFSVQFLEENLAGWLQGTDVLICQNEIPLDTTLHALKLASTAGVYTVFNPAPAPATAADLAKIKPYLRYVSLFCPNESEATQICGYEIKDVDSAKRGAEKMLSDGTGCKSVLITLGSQGSVYMEKGAKEATYVPATKAKAVDSTGAGDCFVGTLAYFMSTGDCLGEAARKATMVAGISVTRKGTQKSYPPRAELPAEMFQQK